MITETEICQCSSTGGSKESNSKGFATHGKIQGGCGLVRRSVVFNCGMCEELSASKHVQSVREDANHTYYCDDCQEAFDLPPVECSLKGCHNWPN